VGWRKTEAAEPDVRVPAPEVDPKLRDEADPDPMVEEMVARLRAGLTSLVAIDEWGRPMAWRNVVRLALGPLGSKIRDTEQALELAVSMIPSSTEGASPEVPVAEVTAAGVPVAEAPPPAPAAPEADDLPLHDEVMQEQSASQPEPPEAPVEHGKTVEVILPAADALPETPVDDAQGHALITTDPEPPASDAPPAAPQASTGSAGSTASASLFVRSGDQRSVPVRALSPRELLGGGGAYDAATPQYDRFLTGLHREGQQVRRDEHRGSGGAGLGHHL
jgi:hypothetical protein